MSTNRSQRDFLDAAVLGRLSRLTVPARIPMLGSITGLHKSAARGSSVEFAEYRKYVPGDDIKHIDWKVYARSDRFFIKEFEADTNLRCTLVLDCSNSMQFGGKDGSKFDYARRLVATLAYLMVRQGDAVGLLAFNGDTIHDIPPRRSPSHLKHIFDTLEKLKPSGTTRLTETMHDLAERMRRRGMVMVFSDLFTELEPLMRSFQHMRFRNHDMAVFHLLDEQEINFQFDRPIRFVDLESNYAMVTDPSIVKRGYQQELDRYLESLKRGCREFEVDYSRIITHDDYEKVLSGFLLKRMQQGRAGGRG